MRHITVATSEAEDVAALWVTAIHDLMQGLHAADSNGALYDVVITQKQRRESGQQGYAKKHRFGPENVRGNACQCWSQDAACGSGEQCRCEAERWK